MNSTIYITTQIIEMLKEETSGVACKVKSSLYNAYQRNNVEIMRVGNIWYAEGSIPAYMQKYLEKYLKQTLNLIHISKTFD